MTLAAKLRTQLYRDEGKKYSVYKDSLGYYTIGVGRMVDSRKGGKLSDDEIEYLLNNDIDNIQKQVLNQIPWSCKLSPARLGVLLNMTFQMGIKGVLRFKNTMKMIEVGDYNGAADGMMNSLWAKQTPKRAKRLSTQMRTGEWQ